MYVGFPSSISQQKAIWRPGMLLLRPVITRLSVHPLILQPTKLLHEQPFWGSQSPRHSASWLWLLSLRQPRPAWPGHASPNQSYGHEQSQLAVALSPQFGKGLSCISRQLQKLIPFWVHNKGRAHALNQLCRWAQTKHWRNKKEKKPLLSLHIVNVPLSSPPLCLPDQTQQVGRNYLTRITFQKNPRQQARIDF